MGKIDDMRKLREQQFATAEAKRSATPRVAAPAAPESVAKPAKVATPAKEPNDAKEPNAKEAKSAKSTVASSGKRGAAADAEGKCSVCGKVRSLNNGLVSEHQKGFGKACPGSRKKPA